MNVFKLPSEVIMKWNSVLQLQSQNKTVLFPGSCRWSWLIHREPEPCHQWSSGFVLPIGNILATRFWHRIQSILFLEYSISLVYILHVFWWYKMLARWFWVRLIIYFPCGQNVCWVMNTITWLISSCMMSKLHGYNNVVTLSLWTLALKLSKTNLSLIVHAFYNQHNNF